MKFEWKEEGCESLSEWTLFSFGESKSEEQEGYIETYKIDVSLVL